jgi:hypothetical protein
MVSLVSPSRLWTPNSGGTKTFSTPKVQTPDCPLQTISFTDSSSYFSTARKKMYEFLNPEPELNTNPPSGIRIAKVSLVVHALECQTLKLYSGMIFLMPGKETY